MAGIEEAFERFADRLAREESKRYIKNQEGDYVEEIQDPYPVKLGPLELGVNANMITGKYSPNEYQNVSTMNRNLGLRGKYNIPESGIALLGSVGDVRNTQNLKTDLPFNPMTGEASPYSEIRKDVYKDSPYSIGAQYNPKGTDQTYSALYSKGGGYNLGYNQGPINVSYTSNPGFGNNVMLRGQYNFALGGPALKTIKPTQKEIDDFVNQPIPMGQMIPVNEFLPGEDYATYVRRKRAETGPLLFAGEPVTTPSTPQINISTNPIAKSLEMAGFTKEEIMKIIGEKGYAYGGLTKTVPPVSGPDPQGVESLFKRRYN